jgi:hypothetical protein
VPVGVITREALSQMHRALGETPHRNEWRPDQAVGERTDVGRIVGVARCQRAPASRQRLRQVALHVAHLPLAPIDMKQTSCVPDILGEHTCARERLLGFRRRIAELGHQPLAAGDLDRQLVLVAHAPFLMRREQAKRGVVIGDCLGVGGPCDGGIASATVFFEGAVSHSCQLSMTSEDLRRRRASCDFQCRDQPRVDRLAAALQQALIGRVTHQRMFEDVPFAAAQAAPEHQLSRPKAVEPGDQFGVGPIGDGGE